MLLFSPRKIKKKKKKLNYHSSCSTKFPTYPNLS